MMDVWEKLLATTFFTPCPKHPGQSQRYYCCHTKAIFCEECKKEHGCDTALKIYRHMYHDAVRVPHKKYVNIQTFVSNGHDVVFLRPHKSLDSAGNHEHHCHCGRGIGKPGWFCSAVCYFNSVHKPPTPVGVAVNLCPKALLYKHTIIAAENRRRQRKLSMPAPSPVC